MIYNVLVCIFNHIDSNKIMNVISMPIAGLAWDWISQKLYWTDYCDDDIEVYDPSSGARRVLFDLDLDAPYGIVVDPITGYDD